MATGEALCLGPKGLLEAPPEALVSVELGTVIYPPFLPNFVIMPIDSSPLTFPSPDKTGCTMVDSNPQPPGTLPLHHPSTMSEEHETLDKM